MADEITTSGNESLNEAAAVESELPEPEETEPSEPVETEEEKQAREAAEAQAKAEAEAQEALDKLVAEAKAVEDARLALVETQKEQAFRCWHHIMTSPRPRDEVRQHLLLLEPEAFAYGKEKIEAELAVLAKEKAEADAAGFSVPVTPAEAAVHDAPKRRGGRGR